MSDVYTERNQKFLEETFPEFMKGLSNFVNHTCQSDKEFKKIFQETLRQDHRTLQASAIRLLIQCLIEYGENASYDLRNEGAVKACQQIKEMSFHIPFI